MAGEREPATCTLELANGRFIHVDHTPSEIKQRVASTRHRTGAESHGFIQVTRTSGVHSRTARGFLEMDVAWSQIVAIHPLQSRGEDE
jgi:hypothetical protein